MFRNGFILGLVGLALLLIVDSANAQEKVKFSGAIFSDYGYVLTSPNGESDGENGFDVRRVYLTSDFNISSKFDARIRFEGSDGTTVSNGRPGIFVKDLYVRWKSALGTGHDLTFGIASPPLWNASEKHWAYRGLEATIMDRGKLASSRDMGVLLRGPVTSDKRLNYSIMFANNSGGKQETDKFKRLYGQLEFQPNESLVFTLGGEMYAFETGNSVSLNGFAGYSFERAALGVEGFYNPKSFDGTNDTDNLVGASLFGRVNVTDTNRLIARYDLLDRDNAGTTSQNNWLILGYSFMPEKGIEIIPNLIWDKNKSDDDATLMGRLTVVASF